MLITKLVATLEDGRQYSVEATKGEGFEAMARILQGVVERNTGVNRTADLINGWVTKINEEALLGMLAVDNKPSL